MHGFDPTHKGFYHGGDLKGMLSKIDYIKGLGTTSIWLTPSFKNKPVQGPSGQETAGYHGYWITDFTQIDPHLGTNADLAALVEAAHARGMKVFFDIITNHTADVITYEQKAGGPAPYTYVSKDEGPYRDASGTPFDDRDYAGTDGFPALDAATSFPFIPHNPAGSENPGNVNHKVPEWLNDVTLYHNRGDTTFVGEDSQYGDFFGLDDLFTEQPRVVDGMADIYKKWITDFRIDGFRIDTMKHVDDEFWRAFAPRPRPRPQRGQAGVPDVRRGVRHHEALHVALHDPGRRPGRARLPVPGRRAAVRGGSGATDALRDFFVADDWYTDGDSNAYQLPTFLGNHDMARIGLFIRNANAGATDDEVFARDRLAHELMYFSRGNPVVYYGDEQGFVGDGGDQDARQDMFPSQVASYNNDDDIGTTETPADDNFDRDHPLYAQARRAGERDPRPPGAAQRGPAAPALEPLGRRLRVLAPGRRPRARVRRGAQQLRAAPDGARADGRRPRAAFTPIYGDRAGCGVTDAGARLPVEVPPLSTVVYRWAAPIPTQPRGPGELHRAAARRRRGARPRGGRRVRRRQLVLRRHLPGEGRRRRLDAIGTDTTAPTACSTTSPSSSRARRCSTGRSCSTTRGTAARATWARPRSPPRRSR